MVKLKTLEDLQNWKDYRIFLKSEFGRLTTDGSPVYISRDAVDFDLGGKSFSGNAVLFGDKSSAVVKSIRKGGLVVREGVARATDGKVSVEGMSGSLVKLANKTLMKMGASFRLVAGSGEDGAAEPDAAALLDLPTYVKFLKAQFKKLSADSSAPFYVSRKPMEFRLSGQKVPLHAVLAGKRAPAFAKALKREGAVFGEGVCFAGTGKQLEVGGLPSAAIRFAERTLKRLKTGYTVTERDAGDASDVAATGEKTIDGQKVSGDVAKPASSGGKDDPPPAGYDSKVSGKGVVEDGKIGAELGHEKAQHDGIGGKEGASLKGNLKVGGGIEAGVDLERSKSDGRGNEFKTGVGVSNKGISVSEEETRATAGGGSTTTSFKGDVNFKDKEAGVSYEKKSKVDEKADEETSKVTGKVKLGDKGGEATVGGEVGRGKKSAGGSVTFKDIWKLTPLKGGKIKVEWVGGAAASMNAGSKGEKAGGSVGISGTSQTTYEAVFDSKEEAKKFVKKHSVPPGYESAEKMRVGDKTTTETGGSVGAGVKATLEGVEFGANIQYGSSTVVSVQRESKHTFIVKYVDLEQLGYGGSIGAVMKLGISWTDTDYGFSVVRFDFRAPEAKSAFQTFKRSGKLQKANGVKLLEKGDTNKQGRKLEVSLGPAKFSYGPETTSTEKTDAQGRKVIVEEGKDSLNASLDLFGDKVSVGGYEIDTSWLKDQYKEEHTVTITEVDGQPAFTIKSTIDAAGRDTAARVIGEVTNEKNHTGEGAPAGDWTVELSVTPAQMEKFAGLVKAEKVNKYSMFHETKYVDRLRTDLKSAKDGRAYYQALTSFFAETGSDGLRFLQESIGDLPASFDLEAVHDPHNVWLSSAEFSAYKSSIRRLDDAIGRQDYSEAVLQEIATKAGELQFKIDKLKNDAVYREIPGVEKANYRKRLGILLDQVLELQKYVEHASKTDGSTVDSHHAEKGRALVKELETKQDRVEKVMKQVKRILRYHTDQFRILARFRVKTEYETVDTHVAAGDKAWDDASESVASARRMSMQLAWAEGDSLFPQLQAEVKKSQRHLRDAVLAYRRADIVMTQITKDHPGGVWNNCPKLK